MARLTNEIRQRIKTAVVEKTFEARRAMHQEARQALALRLYRHYVTEEQESSMRGLPADFFVWTESVSLRLASGHWIEIEMEEARPMPMMLTGRCGREQLTNEVLRDDYLQLDATSDHINDEQRALEAKINSFLAGCTTVKTLYARWPELENYVSRAEFAEATNLPAPLAQDINEMIQRVA